jgi:acyl carrier protein
MTDDNAIPVPTGWPEFDDPEELTRIIDIIAEEGSIERDRITPEATLQTLGVESMDVVMILMGIEDKLDTYLPMDAELADARNLAEFVAAIGKAMKNAAAQTEQPQP